MEYANLGNTGLKVSRLCLGCMTYGTSKWRDWVLDEDVGAALLSSAPLEAGINFFDTADMYSRGVSEEVTGRALRDFARRDEVVIATKVFFPMGDKPNQGGLSRKHIMDAIDGSLRRLGIDYVDLYQIHRWDHDTPIEETMAALHDVVKAGKARYIGASSMFAWQFAKMPVPSGPLRLHPFRLDAESLQPHLSRGGAGDDPAVHRGRHRPDPVEPAGARLPGGHPQPRGLGRRPSAPRPTTTARTCTTRTWTSTWSTACKAVAEARGVKPIQIALAWILHRPGITAPIIGASKMPHLDEAIAALDIALSDDEMAQLEEPYRPHPVLGHD